jgi:hypothetical protein
VRLKSYDDISLCSLSALGASVGASKPTGRCVGAVERRSVERVFRSDSDLHRKTIHTCDHENRLDITGGIPRSGYTERAPPLRGYCFGIVCAIWTPPPTQSVWLAGS